MLRRMEFWGMSTSGSDVLESASDMVTSAVVNNLDIANFPLLTELLLR